MLWMAKSMVEAEKTTQATVLTGGGCIFCAGTGLYEISSLGAAYQPWFSADGPLLKHC